MNTSTCYTMLDLNRATAKAISAERAAAGLTVKELSEKSGIPERTLLRILNSERDIKIYQIAQLAKVFDLYPHEILQEAEKYIERNEHAQVNLSAKEMLDHPTRFELVSNAH